MTSVRGAAPAASCRRPLSFSAAERCWSTLMPTTLDRGALVGWTSYLPRETVDSLPAGTPPVPGPPCSPPGGERGTTIKPGFVLLAGYFTDLAPQLENWRVDGVIATAQYEALKDQQSC
jgi:hypothetical protein